MGYLLRYFGSQLPPHATRIKAGCLPYEIPVNDHRQQYRRHMEDSLATNESVPVYLNMIINPTVAT